VGRDPGSGEGARRLKVARPPRAEGINARTIAARVLARVWQDAAFAAAALDAEIRRHPQLEPRDVGLATELVYGVLRTQGWLEARLAALASRKKAPDAPLARAHLLMGAYSVCFLDRIPRFAAISEAVSGVTAASDERVGGFANAVLRRLGEEQDTKKPAMADAIVESAPGWLRGSLRRALGRSGAAAYLSAGPVPPPIGLCLSPGEDRARWIERLREAAPGATIEPGLISPRAILVRGAGDVRKLPGAMAAEAGFPGETPITSAGGGPPWIVQEEGAQVVALAVGARPGERVLDACAGRGNKVWVLHHDVGPGGAVDAADLYPAKLASLREGGRAGWAGGVYAVDWTAGTGDVPAGYDRVLVDAPCSGVGTLRRRPEIGLHRSADDLARIGALQAEIVLRAATRARDGGRLIVAVCSVLREEAEDLVARVSGAEGAEVTLEPAPFEGDVIRRVAGDAPAVRLLPQVHGTDGYFIASFVVRRG
jgi:16S rRNA (cytosine967-C5)-methyltransferase